MKKLKPLASRCVKFRFSPIGDEAQNERLSLICRGENFALESPNVLDLLI